MPKNSIHIKILSYTTFPGFLFFFFLFHAKIGKLYIDILFSNITIFVMCLILIVYDANVIVCVFCMIDEMYVSK